MTAGRCSPMLYGGSSTLGHVLPPSPPPHPLPLRPLLGQLASFTAASASRQPATGFCFLPSTTVLLQGSRYEAAGRDSGTRFGLRDGTMLQRPRAATTSQERNAAKSQNKTQVRPHSGAVTSGAVSQQEGLPLWGLQVPPVSAWFSPGSPQSKNMM